MEEQGYVAESPVVLDDLGGGEVSQMLASATKSVDVLRTSIAELGHRVQGVRSRQDGPATKELLAEAAMPVSSTLGQLLSGLVDNIQTATREVQRIREDIVL